MRLTTTRLRQLIREELTRGLQEQAAPHISAGAIAELVAVNNGYGPEAREDVESYILDKFGVTRILDLSEEERMLLREIQLVLFSAMPSSEAQPVDQALLMHHLVKIIQGLDKISGVSK